jgi:protein-S-isoprenylcysteine O-methyltransferase Ste14
MNSENLTAHQHRRHADRDDLAGEHKLGDALQLVFGLLFLALWILDSFFLEYSTFLADKISNYIRVPIGVILLIAAGYLSRSGLRIVFKEVRETPQVITKGVFSFVRHPIYLGAILIYAGVICFTMSLLSASLWVIIIIFYWYISLHEEKLLINRFGDEYLEYRKKVPMLFPLKLFR